MENTPINQKEEGWHTEVDVGLDVEHTVPHGIPPTEEKGYIAKNESVERKNKENTPINQKEEGWHAEDDVGLNVEHTVPRGIPPTE